MDEHLLIQKYFSDIGSAFLAERNVEISVGDDASVISSNSNTQQINSLDKDFKLPSSNLKFLIPLLGNIELSIIKIFFGSCFFISFPE